MRVRFRHEELKRLYTDEKYSVGYPEVAIRGYRKYMQIIVNAVDTRDLQAIRSAHFERLKGDRSHQYSMRLNLQWRLVLEIEEDEAGKLIVIVEIQDYH